jgi:integrase
VRVIYGRVTAAFSAAVRDRVIVSTPCVEVKRSGVAPASMLEVVTTEQLLALADAVPARYRAQILTGAGTGLRPDELFGLTVDRVDFLRRSIRVDQQLVYRTGASVSLAPLKTSASYRTVPIAEAVGEALAAHLANWLAHPDLGLVFTNERGAQSRRGRSASSSPVPVTRVGSRRGSHRTTGATTTRASSSAPARP